MKRVIVHVDMDAFYASVEQRDDPSLMGRPVIVGGTTNRGVVSAASYEARRFGIHSAMPIFEAKRKCPEGAFLPVRMGRYKQVSRSVMTVLEGYSPLVEQVSIDEAYVDISGLDRLHGSPKAIASKIKMNIKMMTSLTCSVGVAPGKVFAKIASDMHKPDGLTFIDPENLPLIIRNLPIKKVPGVGHKTAQRLRKLGVSTLSDIGTIPLTALLKEMGRFGTRLLRLSEGVDDSPVAPFNQAKSISSEETLPTNSADPNILKQELLAQAERVGKRLRDGGYKGGTVTLKLKRSDFTQIMKSITLEEPTCSTNAIYHEARKLLGEYEGSGEFRLIGVGVSNLSPVHEIPRQLSLFDGADLKAKSWKEVEKAMDTINERFGGDAIKRGTFLS
ncbi:MAG: DNA polymerase IV [Proteobacteria bacterium]|nr:DNA polymerase IV [Pseudomonadota bacterium]